MRRALAILVTIVLGTGLALGASAAGPHPSKWILRPNLDPVTPSVVAVPVVRPVPGQPGATVASFTVRFASANPGQGVVYFGSGPGCSGLVEVATRDLTSGTTQHAVVVTGNDLPQVVGDNGILPGATYWFEVVTVAQSGPELDNNNG
jgi:hypothetical protein